MAKRVTITDVARETGVSIKTVSNVLNNTGSMRPETRQRVQDAIERLGYRVNVSARAMKTGGTKLIGLAITDFCQPFMPYLADSSVAAARSRGYAVITDTYNSAGGLAQAIPETKKLAADGWIFFMGSPITDRTILHQPYPLVIWAITIRRDWPIGSRCRTWRPYAPRWGRCWIRDAVGSR